VSNQDGFIELAYQGKKRLFNLSKIEVVAKTSDTKCSIFVGSGEEWSIDQSYEEVVFMIAAAGGGR
jgi:hypothetical protein